MFAIVQFENIYPARSQTPHVNISLESKASFKICSAASREDKPDFNFGPGKMSSIAKVIYT